MRAHDCGCNSRLVVYGDELKKVHTVGSNLFIY